MISFTKTRVGGIRASVACGDLLAQEASVILEVAVLNVRMGSEAAYEAAFQQASSIISAMPAISLTNCSGASRSPIAIFSS